MTKLKELLFIFLRFFGVYGLLLFLYQQYLDKYIALGKAVDPFTQYLSVQVSFVLDKLGMVNTLVEDKKIQGIWFYFDEVKRYVTYMNEGCNAISVKIIFVAFALTFYKGFFKTMVYIFGGLAVIYLSNLFRIVLLNYILIEFPSYGKFSHDIIFPVIIYGTVILLWIAWIYYAHLDKLSKVEKSN